ncbi:MAG: hypothetical protein RBS87_06710 [Acholeplasma sp.]|jgi:hypothetical protein|nr:hypothetical protein [Acholeplasma sp.]
MQNSIWSDVHVGLEKSKAVFKYHKQGFYPYLMFILMSLLSQLVILINPIFNLAHMTLGLKVRDDQKLSVSTAFDGPQHINTYWSVLLIKIIQWLLVVVVSIVMVGLFFGLQPVAIAVDNFMNYDKYYAVFVLQILIGVIGGTLIVFIQAYFEPMIFLIVSNPEAKLSDIFNQNKEMMTFSSLIHLIGIKVAFLSRWIIIALILASVGYYFYPIFNDALFYGLVMISSIILLQSLPKLMLGYRVSSITLFKRLLENASYIRLVETNKPLFSNQIRKEDILKSLFDEVIVDVPEPTNTIDETEVK